ncbi:MAG: c-type cytochrome [Bacteroidia bacterium]
MKQLAFYFLIILILLISSCSRSGDQDTLFDFGIPDYINEKIDEPKYNLTTNKGVALGKKLFFDPILSSSNNISCASCHMPSKSFSDGIAQRTSSLSGNRLLRNSPALHNVGFVDSLFWDGGAPNLEFLNSGPIAHEDEMAQDLGALVMKLNEHPEYPSLFKETFEVENFKFYEVSNALSQYMRSLTSFNSKYDQVKRGEATFTAAEQAGYNLYKAQCASCHTEGLFTDNFYHNNGLDSSYKNDTLFGIEKGRFRITFDSLDIGKYKTPNLRNLSFTAPYMHDGRFKTLEEVISHYNNAIKKSPTLDRRLVPKGEKKLSKEDINSLLAFLQTLNDYQFTRNHAK